MKVLTYPASFLETWQEDHSAGTRALGINTLLVFMPSLGFEVRGVVKVVLSEMSWPEIRDLDKDRVVLIPVGTLEDHGLHLPVDTDVRIVGEICRLAAEKAPRELVLLPSVVHGFSPHHMDFPGTITIGWSTFVEYVMDICRSLARHGFRRILIVNGHGSNQNLVEMVARLAVVEYPGVICAAMFYLTGPKGRAAIDKVRESDYPGGIAHACELETSLYLAIKPELVDMGRAVKEIGYPRSEFVWYDFVDGPVKMMEYWSTMSRTGVMGDPTKASVEKGRFLLEAAAEEVVDVVRDLRRRRIGRRVDHHAGAGRGRKKGGR